MPADPVSDRRKDLLRIVVQEYVDSAQPVASQSIADKYNLGVSSATIRNDMAALERDGLLTHPHTSAGRVPTDAGYRYFVRYLVPNIELPSSERRTIRNQFHQSRREIDQWLRLSTAVLSQASNAAALATPPRAVNSRIKHLELIGIRDAVVLLVLVLEEGAVKQQIVSLDAPATQDELSRISNELNEQLAGADMAMMATLLPLLTPLGQDITLLLVEMMENMDGQVGERIYRDGLAQILEAPEFAEGENVRRVVQVMEQGSLLAEILDQMVEVNDVQVLIAGEGRFVELQDISLVLTQYGIENQVIGMIGVIGPLRMTYGRTIGAVRYVAALMSDLMHEYYGSQ